jgi:hypothetical protein
MMAPMIRGGRPGAGAAAPPYSAESPLVVMDKYVGHNDGGRKRYGFLPTPQ